MIEGKPCGLILNHAYSLIDIIEFKDRADPKGNLTINLLRLRNPWGKREWVGPWSDNSDTWQKYPDVAKQLN